MGVACLKYWMLVLAAATACGGGGGSASTNNELEAIKAQIALFGGSEKLEKISSTQWRLSWTPVEHRGLLYGVFVGGDAPSDGGDSAESPTALRNHSGENKGELFKLINEEPQQIPEGVYFNFDSAFRTTYDNVFDYEVENVFAQKATCFIVRVINYIVDENQKVLCTVPEEVNFSGITTVEEQNDGGYLLSWEAIPMNGISYAIYESRDDVEYDFSLPSYDAIEDNFFKVPLLPRGSKYCFIVRYSHKELPADTNKQSHCLNALAPLVFSGITRIDIISSHSVTLNWQSSTSLDVTGYKVYQGSDFVETYGSTKADGISITLDGLVAGRQYSFGIRAMDKFGREDTNLKILSVVMPAVD